jgi:hypothetical protein
MKASPVRQVSVTSIAPDVMAIADVWRIDRISDGKPVTSYSGTMSTLVRRDGRWMIVAFANAPQPEP